ncbi:MAG: ribosomal protein S18-alanine N-acetyltransferase [Gemmatimonadaceae bacterium]
MSHISRLPTPDSRLPSPIVRPARHADLAQITEIERKSFTDAWPSAAFGALIGDQRVNFTVACVNGGAVLGYVVAMFAADECEISNLAVMAERRGQGIGAALLDAVVRDAVSRHTTSIYLEVRESNRAARMLYASRGFVEVNRRRHYYRQPEEDALVLCLALPSATDGCG